MAGPSTPSASGGSIIAKKYRLLGKIGEGSFGVICLGKDIESREQVAIKIETPQTSQLQTLLEEARLLKALHRAHKGGNAVRTFSTLFLLISNMQNNIQRKKKKQNIDSVMKMIQFA